MSANIIKNMASPAELEALEKLGKLFLLQGRLASAKVIYEGLLILEPQNINFTLSLGEIFLRTQEVLKAWNLVHGLLLYSQDSRLVLFSCRAGILLGKKEEVTKIIKIFFKSSVNTNFDPKIKLLAQKLGLPLARNNM